MNKEVWIINQYCGAPKYGMNFRSYYIGKELVRQGYNVTIFTGSYSHLFRKQPVAEKLFSEEEIDGLSYNWVRLRKYSSSKSIGRLLSMFEFSFKLTFFKFKSLKNPNVIVISSLSLIPVINAIKLAKRFKSKLIFEVRDIWPLSLIELGGVSNKNPFVLFLSIIEKIGYKRANRVISVLPNADKHMITRGLEKDRFRYIPNGINLDDQLVGLDLKPKVLNQIPDNKFIVGYTGTIGIANCLDFLLEAAKKLKDESKIHFILVGDGGEKERLISYKESNNLTNVTFIDSIPKNMIQAMLNKFDVCFISANKHPIYRFGVSANKIFDYMYAAKPIIYAIESGNDPISEAECGESIEAANSNALKDSILRLSKMTQNQRDKLGQNGKDYVIKYHSYESLGKKYKDIIEELE